MSLEICRECNCKLSDDGDYCEDCGTLARCQGCRALLKNSKPFCAHCGAAVAVVAAPREPSTGSNNLPAGLNRIVYRYDKGSQSLDAMFTDATADSLAGPLSAALAGRVSAPVLRTRVTVQADPAIIDGETLALPAAIDHVNGREDTAATNEAAGTLIRGSDTTTKARTSVRSADTASGRSQQRSSRVRKPSPKLASWASKWKALALPVDGHAVLQDKKLQERGIFGLWAIREAVGDDGKVVTSGAIAGFLREAFEIQVDTRNLGRSLDKVDKEKVIKDGPRYQITPSGRAYARRLAGLPSDTSSSHEPAAQLSASGQHP